MGLPLVSSFYISPVIKITCKILLPFLIDPTGPTPNIGPVSLILCSQLFTLPFTPQRIISLSFCDWTSSLSILLRVKI